MESTGVVVDGTFMTMLHGHAILFILASTLQMSMKISNIQYLSTGIRI